MDHLIDQFDGFIEFDLHLFKKEWNSGKYKKYSECPSYESLNTTIKSCNLLKKYMRWDLLSIKKMLEDR